MRIIKLVSVLSILLVLSSCDDDTKKDNKITNQSADSTVDNTAQTPDKESKVVCMWKAVSIRKEPKEKGKYITTMYLGETATTHNETVTDTLSKKKRTYLKVTLADNTTGWIQENLVAVDATPYVVIAPTKLYKRPDLIASSDKNFEEMQYVVVTETKGDWVKVKGKKHTAKWFSEGWVKSSKLANDETDVIVAILYEKAQNNTDANKKIKALQEIVNDTDLAKSRWTAKINAEIETIETSLVQRETEEGMEMPRDVAPADAQR